MTRVVLDTNILVSAFRTLTGNEAAVLQAVWDRRITPCLTAAVLAEYDLVLRRPKFSFSRTILDELPERLHRYGVVVQPAQASPISPDPSDTKFIACAVAAGADFLVTGNRRHFPEPAYGSAKVVTARELLVHLA